jgi:hypothetical protein
MRCSASPNPSSTCQPDEFSLHDMRNLHSPVNTDVTRVPIADQALTLDGAVGQVAGVEASGQGPPAGLYAMVCPALSMCQATTQAYVFSIGHLALALENRCLCLCPVRVGPPFFFLCAPLPFSFLYLCLLPPPPSPPPSLPTLPRDAHAPQSELGSDGVPGSPVFIWVPQQTAWMISCRPLSRAARNDPQATCPPCDLEHPVSHSYLQS